MAAPDDATDGPFRSAEEWLADHGIQRDPIRVAPGPAPAPDAPPAAPPPAAGTDQPATDPVGDQAEEPARHEPLEDAVARALAFIRRSTNAQPASEGRLRDKLSQRDLPARAIDLAIERARREQLVDDEVLVHALAEERRAKGHAASRIRMDLRKRGLPDDLIDQALAATEREDPEAVAFGVGRAKAPSYAHLEPEAAFRRLVGYLARRGHAEGLARKVAREVVYVEREAERTAGH